MVTDTRTIEQLTRPASDADLRSLAELLVDAVDSGAAVSFLPPLTVDAAEAWWRTTLATAHARAVILVVRDDAGIVGTVQIQPAWAPNQPHRAEVAKLLVHRRSRGAGLGRRLMEAIELAAREAGFHLLTLDTKEGGVADQLYRRLRWTHVGTIARYALDPDGRTPHSAAIYSKELIRVPVDSRATPIPIPP
ncbi:MAG: GNAT family N-acetyltransferase [Phycisphaerales bacterium]